LESKWNGTLDAHCHTDRHAVFFGHRFGFGNPHHDLDGFSESDADRLSDRNTIAYRDGYRLQDEDTFSNRQPHSLPLSYRHRGHNSLLHKYPIRES
jgi:hypothetical protein